MPPARKRGSQEQGRQLQAYTACRCRGGCRRRQMTTTSHVGSSSFVALNKRKGSTRLAIASEGVGYCRCRGCRRRQMTTTSLHGSSSFVALKEGKKKPTPSRNCKRGGGWFWVRRNPPRLAVACKGVGFCHLYCTVIVSIQ